MSIINLDGSHTVAKKGGQGVSYQGRKKAHTTNMLILTDRKGCPIASSFPVSGSHNDAFELEKTADKMLEDLQQISLTLDGLFLNADAGFDVDALKKLCNLHGIIHNIDENKRNAKTEIESDYILDNELYKNRFVVEQCNAWVDNFRSLIVRYATSLQNWYQLNCLAFASIFLKKYQNFNFYF